MNGNVVVKLRLLAICAVAGMANVRHSNPIAPSIFNIFFIASVLE
jgi:hypothetical protein